MYITDISFLICTIGSAAKKKGIIETQLMTGRSDRDPTIRLSSSQPHPMELGQALGLPDVPGS